MANRSDAARGQATGTGARSVSGELRSRSSYGLSVRTGGRVMTACRFACLLVLLSAGEGDGKKQQMVEVAPPPREPWKWPLSGGTVTAIDGSSITIQGYNIL